MNPIFASDLARMTADFGQAVVWGAYSTTGNLEVATEDLVAEDGFAIVRGETPALTHAVASLPGLKRKDTLTVGGIAYRVKHLDLEGDGLVGIAYLERA
jgi:hypothetical protein